MAVKRWTNIGYDNFQQQDWKEKFMHHEKKGHGNLWGKGSWLAQQGYIRPKSSKRSSRDQRKDKNWTWDNPYKGDKKKMWALFGQLSGHGKKDEGYIRFDIDDINESNYSKVNWERQYKRKGWWDHVKDDWVGGSGKREKWQNYLTGYPEPITEEPDPAQVTPPVADTDQAAADDVAESIEEVNEVPASPWSPGEYGQTQGVRHGLLTGGDSSTISARNFFGRRGGRVARRKQKQDPSLTIGSLNI